MMALKLIVTSSKDPASLNIKRALMDLVDFKESSLNFDGAPIMFRGDVALVTVDKELIHADHIDGLLDAELAVFASRHESSSKLPSLLTHIPGNWTLKAEAGGKPKSLCRACPSVLKETLLELEAQRRRLGLHEWLCGVEATHHGPYLEKTPAIFVEIGSSEEEWLNKTAAIAVANAILKAVSSKVSYRPLLCFGGTHYAPKFTKLMLETAWTAAYIAPKYVVDELDEAILAHALQRSCEAVEAAALDWKGLKGAQREALIKLLSKVGLKVCKADELFEREGI